MDQVAVDYPELKMVLAHMGHPWEGETIAVIRRNKNLFADISALYYRPWQFYNSMRLAEEYHTSHKLLFGSDFPFVTTGDSLKGLYNINDVLGQCGLPGISNETIAGIIHRDSLALLGLKDPRQP
jgi:predicted TIM-barrel fold metal-dependent hydrolase